MSQFLLLRALGQRNMEDYPELSVWGLDVSNLLEIEVKHFLPITFRTSAQKKLLYFHMAAR